MVIGHQTAPVATAGQKGGTAHHPAEERFEKTCKWICKQFEFGWNYLGNIIYQGLTPVANLKAKKENIDLFGFPSSSSQPSVDKPVTVTTSIPSTASGGDAYSWDVIDEYNPLWPNEYEKLTKDRKAKEPPKQPMNNYGGRNKREYKRGINLNKMHARGGGGGGGGAGGDDGPGAKKSGFAGRPSSDDEEEFRPGLKSGAAIAPPASLQESVAQIPDGSKYILSTRIRYGI